MKNLLAIIISTFFVLMSGQASASALYSGANSLDQLSKPMVCGSHSEEEKKKKKGGEEEEPECE